MEVTVEIFAPRSRISMTTYEYFCPPKHDPSDDDHGYSNRTFPSIYREKMIVSNKDSRCRATITVIDPALNSAVVQEEISQSMSQLNAGPA